MGTSKNVRALGVVLAASSALVLGVGVFSTNGKAASPATTTMPVKLKIQDQCEVSATELDFGTASFIDSDITANTTISVRCTKGTKYTVTISPGGSFDGASRNMKNTAGETIAYRLYQEAGLKNPWGTSSTSTVDGKGTSKFDVFGVVPKQGDGEFTAGDYSDTVTIQVDY